MSVRSLRLLSACLARHLLLTLIVSVCAVFTASYFYFTTMHALESFNTTACTPLAFDSAGSCVSRLQKLLDETEPYPDIGVDGKFGEQTDQAVIDFQIIHNLAVDGVVGSKTADAINQFSPRPNIFSYAAGFANSQLALSAKLCVAALTIAVTTICLLLRAAQTGFNTMLRIRCALAGLFAALIAANSAATESLMTEAHGWVAKAMCIILIALIAALLRLLGEMFPNIPALSRTDYGD